MKKRLAAMMLGVSLMLSAAACGTEEKESGGSGAAQASGQGESAQEQGSTGASEKSGEERGDPVTLTVEVYERGNMPEAYGTCIDNRWVEMMRDTVLEELNIDLQYVAIPRSEDIKKIQALMSAGNEPDIFYVYNEEQFLKWADDEALADLTPYMDTEAGQAIRNFLGQDALEYGKIDDRQYSINGVRYDQGMLSSFIRKDLLEKVEVELREVNGHYVMTPAELEEALLRIKNAGLCDYPMALLNQFQQLQPIEGAFLEDASVDDTEKLMQNMTNTFFTIDGDKEAFRFLNRCFNEGLINPDFALYKDENLQEMISSGQTAFWSNAYWTMCTPAAALYEDMPEAEIVAVEIVQEDNSPARYYKYAPISAYGMVSSNCENPEAALELLSWFLTSEKAHYITWHGVEGEHYAVDGDGDPVAIDPEYNKTDRISVTDLNVLLNTCPCKKDDESFARLYHKDQDGVADDRVIEAYLSGHMIAVSEGKMAPPAVNRIINAISDYTTSLEENRDNLIVGSITAPVDKFDEVYDRYLEIYMEEGGAQVAEEKLAAVQ